MSFAQGDDAANSKITAQGYMFKKCRINGDTKPWKKRFFVLQGGTLLYYQHANMAGAFKLFIHLSPECTIEKSNEIPWNNKDSPAIRIKSGSKLLGLATLSDEKFQYWLNALEEAKTRPPIELPDQTYKYAKGSTTMKLKMGLSAALASSAFGRRLLKSYMDDSSRNLISTLIKYAETTAGSTKSKSYEKGIFDLAARIAVIWRSGKVPPDLDLSLLHDETINFCQDFLMYSRDQRLKEKRGPLAEIQPLNMPELMRSSGVVTDMWQQILNPHVSTKTKATFITITEFYFDEGQIQSLLTEPKHFELTFSIEKSLREVLEHY